MKIGVVSDTHSHLIPKKLLEDFKTVDLIIHAGDFCTKDDLNIFKKIKKVRAVFGNMDGLEIRQILPEKDIFQVDGVTIGLFHGHGSPDKVPKIVRSEFKGNKVHVVIFGHSHCPFNETIDGVLYFNPGSPNDVVRAPYRSYGMLDINHGQVTARIIKVDG
jgi:hypothetical protein